MVFSSSIFLFGFLPILFIIYFISPKKLKNYVLLVFSLIFYFFGGPSYILIILGVVLIDYLFAIFIDRFNNRKLFLILAIISNIGILFYYKYFNFVIDNINAVFDINVSVNKIVLPIGISFFIFQALSYVIDVYRGEVKVQKNPFLLLLYVSFFPQLVAGPIVRYQTIEEEITSRKVDLDDFAYGIERFILGFAKKMIIANQLGKLADIVYGLDELSTPVVFLGVVSYMLQIYFDFSAYSDMAIGLGRVFGFHFLENFDYPYISKSITSFWRRWHISLSTWFRDYIYIPLGGNRKGVLRQILNLFIVWTLTGFWHGASWNFVLWGLYYFVFLMLEKFIFKKYLKNIPNFFKHIYTLIVVLVGWILFRSDNLSVCFRMIKYLFSFNITSIGFSEARIYLETYYVYFILGILFSIPVYPYLIKKIDGIKNKNIKFILEVMHYGFLIVIFIISIMFLAKSSYNPFIYFRF